MVPMSSNNSALMSCLTCQIHDYFMEAGILVGLHGAGKLRTIYITYTDITFPARICM